MNTLFPGTVKMRLGNQLSSMPFQWHREQPQCTEQMRDGNSREGNDLGKGKDDLKS